MFDHIKTLRQKLRELAELAEMSEADLLDLGLNRDQIETLVCLPPDVGQRMAAMARIFGLSEADLTERRPDYVEMLTTCSQCGALRPCAAQLAKGAAARAEDSGFCPNAGNFAAMASARQA